MLRTFDDAEGVDGASPVSLPYPPTATSTTLLVRNYILIVLPLSRTHFRLNFLLAEASMFPATKPFRFLDLPPEIRQKIYTLLVQDPDDYPISLSPITASDLGPFFPSFPHSALLVNTQIYHELRPLYFSTNTFSLVILRHNSLWSHVLSSSFLDARRSIRSLKLNLLRWGSKNFFIDSLVPMLEDMILNGKLRRLEVLVKDYGHYKRNSEFAIVEGEREKNGEEYANWGELRRICSDPYLESVRLRVEERDGKVVDAWTKYEHVPFIIN